MTVKLLCSLRTTRHSLLDDGQRAVLKEEQQYGVNGPAEQRNFER